MSFQKPFLVEKFNNLFSLGTGGEFNYSDSQIIFHKVMDLVKNLDSKESIENQVVKDYNNIVLNEKVKLGKYTVGDKSVYVIAEAGLNHNGDYKLGIKLIDEAKKLAVMQSNFKALFLQKEFLRKLKVLSILKS